MMRFDIPVRGYKNELEASRHFFSQTIEWRMPLVEVFRGMGLIPLYYEQLHAAIFYDYGILVGSYDSADIFVGEDSFIVQDERETFGRRGAGFEIRLKTMLGYRFPMNFVVRLAYAPDINEIPGVQNKDGYLAEADYEIGF